MKAVGWLDMTLRNRWNRSAFCGVYLSAALVESTYPASPPLKCVYNDAGLSSAGSPAPAP
jgi:hypothetical protein